MIRKIIHNKIRCKYCGDVIESEYVHDFKWCSCGLVAVDGGRDYLKRTYRDSVDDFEEMSEVKYIKEE